MSEIIQFTQGDNTVRPGKDWEKVVEYFRIKHPYGVDPLGRMIGYAATIQGLPVRETVVTFAAAAVPPIVDNEFTRFNHAANEPAELTGMINRAIQTGGRE